MPGSILSAMGFVFSFVELAEGLVVGRQVLRVRDRLAEERDRDVADLTPRGRPGCRA
jgi:hypothetical protein